MECNYLDVDNKIIRINLSKLKSGTYYLYNKYNSGSLITASRVGLNLYKDDLLFEITLSYNKFKYEEEYCDEYAEDFSDSYSVSTTVNQDILDQTIVCKNSTQLYNFFKNEKLTLINYFMSQKDIVRLIDVECLFSNNKKKVYTFYVEENVNFLDLKIGDVVKSSKMLGRIKQIRNDYISLTANNLSLYPYYYRSITKHCQEDYITLYNYQSRDIQYDKVAIKNISNNINKNEEYCIINYDNIILLGLLSEQSKLKMLIKTLEDAYRFKNDMYRNIIYTNDYLDKVEINSLKDFIKYALTDKYKIMINLKGELSTIYIDN